jgi:hypothetical protein
LKGQLTQRSDVCDLAEKLRADECASEGKEHFGEEIRVHNIQSFQILTVLPTEASVSLPHPVPARGIFASSSKENDSIVRFHIKVKIREYPGKEHIVINFPGVRECRRVEDHHGTRLIIYTGLVYQLADD